jgi:hypothetical protein
MKSLIYRPIKRVIPRKHLVETRRYLAKIRAIKAKETLNEATDDPAWMD